VLSIDIDDFKDFNYSLSREGGDVLLAQMSVRLKGCVRPHDLVASLGGDEFAIVVLEDDAGSAAVVIAERILKVLRAPFTVRGTRLHVAVSIGVAERRPETADAVEMLRDADFAMGMAKSGGKNRYQLFDVQLHDDMVARSALKADLARAVSSRQLRPRVPARRRPPHRRGRRSGGNWSAGSTPPWACWPRSVHRPGGGDRRHRRHRLLGARHRSPPGRRVACDDAPLRGALGLGQHLRRPLPRPDGLAAIQAILADPAVQADKVVLEVAETALASDADGGVASLNSLKRFGVRIAIDDFGTGYSSLSTLATLPVDILKIDRCFVSGQASTTPSVPMLEGIIGLANKLSLDVIAEGIEEPEQLHLVRTMGCQMGQGYLLARPAPADVLEALLSSRGQWPSPSPRNAKSHRLASRGVAHSGAFQLDDWAFPTSPGQVCELGVVLEEGQLDLADGPTPVLRDVDLGDPTLGRIRMVDLVSIDKTSQRRILFGWNYEDESHWR